MTSKILRSDNTPIPSIKSVVYKENISATTDLRPGCVASSYIEVTVYGAQSTAPSAGEPLKFYRVSANGVEKYIGTFYAEPSIQSRNTYSFVAFDIVDRLNVNFSERLLAIQENFPMTLGALVTEACSVAGVQLLSTNFPLHEMSVQSFYVEGLTCRDILSYAAEIACRFVRCDANEKIVFDWYAEKEDYRIFPTSQDGSETRIAYKQNGLSYQSFSVQNVGCVAVRPLNTENAAYIYPDTFEAVTATDPLSNGVVTLYNLTAVDNGNGAISLSGNFSTTDTDSNVEISPDGGGGANNTLVIANNILLTNAESETMEAVAEWIYTEMSEIPVYRPARAELFPAENPFRTGDIVAVTDVQGVSFAMPIMSMTVEQSAAVVESTGNKSYDADYGSDTSKQLQNLSNSIVQIDRLKVGYAEIDEAVIGTLEANGINADWINAGRVSVEYVDFTKPSTHLEFPVIGDPSTLFSGQSYSNGWITQATPTAGGTYRFSVARGYCTDIRGKTIEVAFEYDGSSGLTLVNESTWVRYVGEEMYVGNIFAEGVSDVAAGVPPTISTDGVVSGNITVGENGEQIYRNSMKFVVDDSWDYVSLVYSSAHQIFIRNITVTVIANKDFSIGYSNNNHLGYDGLKLGLLVIDETGNLTCGGDTVLQDTVAEGDLSVSGDLTVDGEINQVGALASLTTTDKSDLVSAINEVDGDITDVDGKVGTLSSLTTTDQTDLVSAINEVNAKPIPTIGYVDDTTARSITLNNGFAAVVPQSALPTGAKIFSIAAIEWGSTNRVSFVPYGANATYGYAVGEPGDTITGLKCRFWYIV